MRKSTLITALAVGLFVADSLQAQRRSGGRGRNQWRRPQEITNRVGVFFTDTPAPETNGDKIADLNTIDLVRAASAAGQVTVLYLHDGEAERRVVQQFESGLFRSDQSGDELGIKLRMFHCGQIDISTSPTLKNHYGKEAPLFVAFNKAGKELKPVSMTGYKAKPSALEALIDKASTGAFKPSLKTFAKKYGNLILDLEKTLKDKSKAEDDQAKAGNDKSKQKKAEKELAAAEKEEEKILKKEEELLEGMRLPARGSKQLGGRNPRRGNQAGNTGKGNTGKGNGGRGNGGRGNGGGGGGQGNGGD